MFLLSPDIFPWDLALLIMISLSTSGAIACFCWMWRHKGGLLARGAVSLLGCTAVLALGLLLYGSFIEPHTIVVTQKAVPFPTDEELTIAVLGDFHVGPYKGRADIDRAVRTANAQLPDVILLTGDFVLGNEADLSMLEPIGDLRAPLGVYAVLGNHDIGRLRNSLTKTMYVKKDRSAEITAFLEKLGVTVLINDHRTVRVGAKDIAIAGVLDLWTGRADLAAALSGIDEGTPTILLSHNPGIILNNRIGQVDLVLSGHTHGGQIRLPLLGPLTPPATDIGRAYDQGIFSISDRTTLAITRGLSESSARARLFAWPEVLVLQTVQER